MFRSLGRLGEHLPIVLTDFGLAFAALDNEEVVASSKNAVQQLFVSDFPHKLDEGFKHGIVGPRAESRGGGELLFLIVGFERFLNDFSGLGPAGRTEQAGEGVFHLVVDGGGLG